MKNNIKNHLKNNLKNKLKITTTHDIYNTMYYSALFYNKKTFLIATPFTLWTLLACATHMPHALWCSATANGQK